MTKEQLRAKLFELIRQNKLDGEIDALMRKLLPALDFVKSTMLSNQEVDRQKIRDEQAKWIRLARSSHYGLITHVTGMTKEEFIEYMRTPYVPRYESAAHFHFLMAKHTVPLLVTHGGFKAVDTKGNPIERALEVIYQYIDAPHLAGLNTSARTKKKQPVKPVNVNPRSTLAKYRELQKTPLVKT